MCTEYIKLIRDHRIFGSLDGGVGGSLNKPRGSSLPVRLSGIEAHYLVKHGIANAFRVPALNQRKPEIPHDKVIELKRQRREEQVQTDCFNDYINNHLPNFTLPLDC